MTSKKRK